MGGKYVDIVFVRYRITLVALVEIEGIQDSKDGIMKNIGFLSCNLAFFGQKSECQHA